MNIRTCEGEQQMRVDKNYCMSSYLIFRYMYDSEICFKEGIAHHDHELGSNDKKFFAEQLWTLT